MRRLAMIRRSNLAAAAALLFLPLIFSTIAVAQTLPPVQSFGRLPNIRDPQLSPNGQYFAAIQTGNGHPIVTIYAVGRSQGKLATLDGGDWTITGIEWAKNDRLAIIAKKSIRGWDGDVQTWVRELAVSPTGGDVALLNSNEPSLKFNIRSAGFVDRDLDDPDKVYMPLYVSHAQQPLRLNLQEVNVRTGGSYLAMEGSFSTREWFTDGHGHVVARIDQTVDPLVDHLKFYDGKNWHDAGDFDASAGKGAGLIGLTEDGSPVFVRQDRRGMDALLALPMNSPSSEAKVLLSNPDYDIDDPVFDGWTGRIVGAIFQDDRTEVAYFDPGRQALQRVLESASRISPFSVFQVTFRGSTLL